MIEQRIPTGQIHYMNNAWYCATAGAGNAFGPYTTSKRALAAMKRRGYTVTMRSVAKEVPPPVFKRNVVKTWVIGATERGLLVLHTWASK